MQIVTVDSSITDTLSALFFSRKNYISLPVKIPIYCPYSLDFDKFKPIGDVCAQRSYLVT